jgi:hypothetical protein
MLVHILSRRWPSRGGTGTRGPNSPDPELLVSSRSTIKLTDNLGAGGTCAAYRGTWFGVAKYVDVMDDARKLSEEVHAHLRLGHLRGSVIPKFFGLYRSDSFSLFVLEVAGDMINNKHFGPEPRTRPNRATFDKWAPLDDTFDEWAALDEQDRCAFEFHVIKHS